MKDLFHAYILAVQFLTRIPVPVSVEPNESTARRALMFFPLVGWLLGLLLFCLWWLIDLSGISSAFTAAAIIITAETILTGAFHLDGLADTFDAFLSSGTTREEKLSIMKDSRIGVMGATSLILSLLLKTALLSELIATNMELALIIYPIVGRWVQVALYVTCTYVREDGTGLMFAKAADQKTLLAATLLMLPYFALLFAPFTLVVLILFIYWYRHYVRKLVGGITGDILGAVTVISEIVFLLGIVIANT